MIVMVIEVGRNVNKMEMEIEQGFLYKFLFIDFNKHKKMEVKIKTEVIEKIIKEKENHQDLEFGGWVIVEDDIITDVIFDMKHQSHGDVILDCKEVLKLDKDIQKNVAGFFHKHPICGLSGIDLNTMNQLTNLWGKCYTLVWQSNDFLSIHVTDKEKGLIHESWTPIELEKSNGRVANLINSL